MTSTKIVAISRVKNEADFIERFIRINGQIVDAFVIFDDQSSDETISIIQNLHAEGYPIALGKIQDAQNNHAFFTDMMFQLAQRFTPDYIIPLDADELLITEKSRLLAELEELTPQQYGRLPWQTYIPVNGELLPTSYLTDIFQPLLQEAHQYHKAIVPAHAKGNFIMGSHQIKGDVIPVRLKTRLAHFPIRSAVQLMAKALITAHKFELKNDPTKPNEGYHIKRIANEIIRCQYRLDSDDLKRLALSYLGIESQAEYAPWSPFVEPELKYTPEALPLAHYLYRYIFELSAEPSK